MKTKIKKNLIIAVVTLFLFAFFVLSALPLTNANADGETIYTNVMDDLKKDEKFNTDDYPAVKDDYSLKVIQIAESSAKELFVYTYQPAHATRDLIATSINISTGTGDELSYWNYGLRLLSTNGVFDKYLVKDFKVSTEEERTYDISNIYRAWNKDIDNATGNDNTISEVGYKVGRCFYSKTDENGNVLYGATGTEVVTITDKYVGFLRYSSRPSWFPFGQWKTDKVDCHYVAFSTENNIDFLLSADIFFRTQSYSVIKNNFQTGIDEINKGFWTYGNVLNQRVTLSYDDTVIVDNSGDYFWKGSTKTWNRIRTVADFKKAENLTTTALAGLNSKGYVLQFFETPYSIIEGDWDSKCSGTNVSDVSILRLEFETDGIVYNLGVVDNKMSGDDKPDNNEHDCILWKLLAVLIIVGLVAWFLNQIFPWFYPLLGKLIAGAFKAIWYIISFKWLRDLIRWKKDKQPQQVVVVNSTNNAKRKRKGKKKPPTK